MTEYRPAFAPHVVGEFELATDRETGRPEPTMVHMTCETCGERHRVRCDSGAPRQWVLRFAVVHAHRDALKDPFPRQEKKR